MDHEIIVAKKARDELKVKCIIKYTYMLSYNL